MKNITILFLLLIFQFHSIAQVGIGTTTPNEKSILELNSTTDGLLIPRMTGAQRQAMSLSSADVGMLVYQTDLVTSPTTNKGLYAFDGSNWIAPLVNGTTNGSMLRWDGARWLTSNYLFNSGSAIGIGTSNPNTQFHVHSNIADNTRVQLTGGMNNGLQNDGLLLGVTQATNEAYIIQQENQHLWFGTSDVERMRLDADGNLGINKTDPSAKLEVSGTVILGTHGTVINGIMRDSVSIDIPSMTADNIYIADILFENAIQSATVYVSPGNAMNDIVIAYARVSSPGHVEIKFLNMASATNDPADTMFYITVIQ